MSSSTSGSGLDWIQLALRCPNGRRIDVRFPPEKTPLQVRDILLKDMLPERAEHSSGKGSVIFQLIAHHYITRIKQERKIEI